jgi:hypothetical protein
MFALNCPVWGGFIKGCEASLLKAAFFISGQNSGHEASPTLCNRELCRHALSL